MIVDKMYKPRKIELDLTGPEGNVFVLIGCARTLSRKLMKNGDEIIKKMMSEDYENAVQTFEKEFGDLVILYR